MEGCPACESVIKGSQPGIILQNDFAVAFASGRFREGHCIVTLKRHVISVSQVEPHEYSAFFDLIARVAGALEKNYSARKTYVFTVGDSDKWQHLHFHLLPKHRGLPSWGVYAIQKMHESEPLKNPGEADQQALAEELRNMINPPVS